MNYDRFRDDAVYNTRAVVQRTGVPADTFRAWERRYGVPSPKRTAGNQRLYSERDIAMIAWLRDQTQTGLTISQAIALLRSDSTAKDEAAEERDGVTWVRVTPERRTVPSNANGDRFAEYRRAIVDAWINYDGGRANHLIEEATAFLPVEDVCVHVLQAGLNEIGQLWEQEAVSVSVEHYASQFVLRKFASLFNLSQPHQGRGPIVAACVDGELHEIGLLLTSLFISRRGYRVIYLGPDLPLPGLMQIVRDMDPAMVLLSASSEESADRLADAAAALSSPAVLRSSTTPTVGYGGGIFATNPQLRDAVHGQYLGDDALAAVDSIERIMAATFV